MRDDSSGSSIRRASAGSPHHPPTLQWTVVVFYALFCVVGAAWASAYLKRVGGTGGIPDAVYLALGPIIALGSGHGIEIFAATTALILPLLLWAARTRGHQRAILLIVAAMIWAGVGRWMYGG